MTTQAPMKTACAVLSANDTRDMRGGNAILKCGNRTFRFYCAVRDNPLEETEVLTSGVGSP